MQGVVIDDDRSIKDAMQGVVSRLWHTKSILRRGSVLLEMLLSTAGNFPAGIQYNTSLDSTCQRFLPSNSRIINEQDIWIDYREHVKW